MYMHCCYSRKEKRKKNKNSGNDINWDSVMGRAGD